MERITRSLPDRCSRVFCSTLHLPSACNMKPNRLPSALATLLATCSHCGQSCRAHSFYTSALLLFWALGWLVGGRTLVSHPPFAVTSLSISPYSILDICASSLDSRPVRDNLLHDSSLFPCTAACSSSSSLPRLQSLSRCMQMNKNYHPCTVSIAVSTARAAFAPRCLCIRILFLLSPILVVYSCLPSQPYRNSHTRSDNHSTFDLRRIPVPSHSLLHSHRMRRSHLCVISCALSGRCSISHRSRLGL